MNDGAENIGGGSESVATQQGSGGDFNAQDYVSPELEAKFAQVFEGKSLDEGGESTPKMPAAKPQTKPRFNPAQQRQRRIAAMEGQQDETLEGLEDAGSDENQPAPVTKPPLGQRQQPTQAGEQDAPLQGEATLNPLLRTAAKRVGWTDEDIDAMYSDNPEMAERTFSRFLSSLNDLSSRYGRLGPQQQQPPQGWQGYQQAGQQQLPPQQQQRQAPAQQGGDPLAEFFGPTYTQDFNDRYGETFVKDVIQPLHERVIAPLQQVMSYINQQENSRVRTQIDGFFKNLKDFTDLYGNGKLSQEQDQTRWQVCQLADQIRAGALAQGQGMDIEEALESAHLIVANDYMAQNQRKQITQQVKQRAKGITARPTARTPGNALARGEKSDAAAMQAYEQKAAEIGLV